jgi:hypothetical protein
MDIFISIVVIGAIVVLIYLMTRKGKSQPVSSRGGRGTETSDAVAKAIFLSEMRTIFKSHISKEKKGLFLEANISKINKWLLSETFRKEYDSIILTYGG